jgi:hypothetical protein
MSENKTKVQLSAIDPFIASNIVLPTETKVRGKDYVITQFCNLVLKKSALSL